MRNTLLSILLIGLFQSTVFANKIEIKTDEAPLPIGTYSQAIKSGSTVYLSGQIAISPKTGELISDNIEEQVIQTMKNLEQVVIAAGGSLDDIVKLTVFLTDLKNFNCVNNVMENIFKRPYPARSAVEIKALPKGAKIEIEAIMNIP